MQIKSDNTAVHRDIKAKVFAAMETGNTGNAKTALREYHEVFPTEADALRLDVISAYGIAL